VLALVTLFQAHWDAVKGKCGITEAELDRAAVAALQLFTLLSRRQHRAKASASDATLRLRRAWTLMDRAYAQCRRALHYLRFAAGDADLIAPSLRKNSGPRRRTKPDAPAEEETAVD
jgi:hypothetical protein